MRNGKWQIFFSLSIPANTQIDKKGNPPALSPSLTGSFNIGGHKDHRFCYANPWFAT
jgi:hypothetical protein